VLIFGLISLLSPLVAQQTLLGGFFYQGVWRDYRLSVPATYTGESPVPLIVNLHGLGSNAYEQELYANFPAVADTAGFLTVQPNGIANSWNAGFIIGGPDDLGFLTRLVDHLAESYALDPARIYATGMSNGGFMSHYLACERSGRFAAIASVTGTMSPFVYQNCDPGRPVPVMQIHGTADAVVPYGGSAAFVPVDSLVAFWAAYNQCDPVPDTSLVPDVIPWDSSTAVRYTYLGDLAESEVVLYRVENGGHTWPGAISLPGTVTNLDFRASVEIWRFFRRHPHPDPEPLGTTTALEAGPEALQAGPNPFAEALHLSYRGSGEAQVTVYDGQGRKVYAARLWAEQPHRIDTRPWAAGVYHLQLESPQGSLHRKLVRP